MTSSVCCIFCGSSFLWKTPLYGVNPFPANVENMVSS